MYLSNISFVTSIHQFIFTNPRIVFNKIWCYDYFNDAVKSILMPPQDLEKVGWFQSRKNNKYLNKYFDMDWGIGESMLWTR